MRIFDQPAFVLHARPWRETSLLIELLSRDYGRIGAVVRGVRGPKKQLLRACLQPLQSIHVDLLLRGELAQVNRAEAIDIAPRLTGDALLAIFYIHELILKLLQRQDPAIAIYQRYQQLRTTLAEQPNLAWEVRRFERDLLDEIGVGPAWGFDSLGDTIDPAGRYRIDPEQGPVRDTSHASGSISGQALLALADDQLPNATDLLELRSALIILLDHQLSGRGLSTRRILVDLAHLRSNHCR